MRLVSLNMETVTGVGVLDKAMCVLAAVIDGPCSLGALQIKTELPRATAHRLATALEVHGMLRRDAAGRFELGHGLVPLGRMAIERFPLAASVRPVLEDLRTTTGESVQLFVREGDQRRCLLSLESPHQLRWTVPEGARYPIDVGSAGRVLLGELGPEGWVESVGEREAGAASVSAPIVRGGELLAAVCVSGPIDRISQEPGKRFGDAVVAAAAA